MNYDNLPIHTKIFEENKVGGILLSGINPGYSKNDELLDVAGVEQSDTHKSFFSDKEANDYPFRNNITKWFKLWGYDLKSSKKDATSFEKSIIQTNWIQTCSNNMNGTNTMKACIEDSDLFLETCEILKPKVICLFSKELMGAFNSAQLKPRVSEIFGFQIGTTNWIQKDVIDVGKNCRRFRFGFQKYEKATVISLPHATSSRGLADAYIADFKAEMSEILDNWWCEHKKKLTNGSSSFRG